MREPTAAAFFELVSGRAGHSRLESGHHSGLGLDLDTLFASPRRVEPFVARLTGALRSYEVESVCGPLLGGAFLAQLVARELGVELSFTERILPAERGGLYEARYRLPPALAARARGKRFAIVDDVMSAGSALLGTCAELRGQSALPVVAGALLVLGTTGAGRFAQEVIPVEAVLRQDFELWPPAECPLCASGVPIEDVASPTA